MSVSSLAPAFPTPSSIVFWHFWTPRRKSSISGAKTWNSRLKLVHLTAKMFLWEAFYLYWPALCGIRRVNVQTRTNWIWLRLWQKLPWCFVYLHVVQLLHSPRHRPSFPSSNGIEKDKLYSPKVISIRIFLPFDFKNPEYFTVEGWVDCKISWSTEIADL